MKERIFLLFFDAKMETYEQRKEYQKFLKSIKGKGYSILQKSVYYKSVCSDIRINEEQKTIIKITPVSIEIRLLPLSKKQFKNIVNINCKKIELLENKTIICF